MTLSIYPYGFEIYASLSEEILEGEPKFQFTNIAVMEIALQDLSIALAKNESRNLCLVFENVLYCTLMQIDSDRSTWFSEASYPMFSLIVNLNIVNNFRSNNKFWFNSNSWPNSNG
jgi:hypothetical protein